MTSAVTPELNVHISPWLNTNAPTNAMPPQPAPGVLPFEPVPGTNVPTSPMAHRRQSRKARLQAAVNAGAMEPPQSQETAVGITAQQAIAAGKRGPLLCSACGQRAGRVFRLRGSLNHVNVVCRGSVGGCGRVVNVPFA